MALNQQPKNIRYGYNRNSGVVALSAPTNKQLLIHSIACVNGSASSSNIGIGYSLGASASAVFTASGGAATAYTSGAYLNSNGAQIYVQSEQNEILDFVVFNNSVLASGGSPAYTYEYWNGSWTAITPQEAADYTKTSTAVIIGPPLDWIKGSGGVSGLDTNRYTFRINAVTAASTPPQASSILVCKLLIYREAIESKQALEVNFTGEHQFLMNAGQGIMPYFSNADLDNSIELSYRISG